MTRNLSFCTGVKFPHFFLASSALAPGSGKLDEHLPERSRSPLVTQYGLAANERGPEARPPGLSFSSSLRARLRRGHVVPPSRPPHQEDAHPLVKVVRHLLVALDIEP